MNIQTIKQKLPTTIGAFVKKHFLTLLLKFQPYYETIHSYVFMHFILN
jgi:hypothetical protein